MDVWIKVMLWVLGVQCVTEILCLGMGAKIEKKASGLAINVLVNGVLFVMGLIQFMKH